MEKVLRHTVLLSAVLCCSTLLYAGEKFKWMTFNEGISEAQRTGKKIMIDVYTDWCGWCKKMDKDTYADGTIANYLGTKYVAIRLNAESSKTLSYRGQSYTERELAAAFGVTGYPSIIFLKSDGEPITVYPGYADAAKFGIVLSYIADDHYQKTDFQDYARTRR